MEDAATAEISLSQLWPWLHHGANLEDGRPLTVEAHQRFRNDELFELRDTMSEEHWGRGRFEAAARVHDEPLGPDREH